MNKLFLRLLNSSIYRLATVLNADRIVFIDKGQVIEEGTYSELIAKKGRFYHLHKENQAETGDVGDIESKPAETKPRKTSFLTFLD